jgi:hypothetical protein
MCFGNPIPHPESPQKTSGSTQAADVDMVLGFCRADVAVVFHVQNLCLMDTEEKPLQMTIWG